MNKFFQMAALAAGLMAAATGSAAAMSDILHMPTLGQTSQPVGHYEFCKQYASECQPNETRGAVKLTRAVWAAMVGVNNTANTTIYPRTDEEIYGVPEVWAYPTTQGDCEDFALLKQYMLERQGLPRSALLITVVRQPNGDGHAVLTVKTDKGDFILDNLEERILAWTETEYHYLKRQSEQDSSKWVGIADDRNILVGSVR
ncbi:transglutaminase-like cysteine peptidase [Mangrovicella endophytica]|uniref:transglutaminase-like cysteine peptidase n=1 Tax=Mangrovicella endophytica TaxID=2066697 RepID=UPI001FE0C98F|nr:transglutaminase-like cysteine peptidase [Mangrovicella endophytica]